MGGFWVWIVVGVRGGGGGWWEVGSGEGERG